jgi:hypothetical protein
VTHYLMFAFIASASTCLTAAPPAVREVMGTAGDQILTALSDRGDTPVNVSETRIDLDFPSGKSGKGTLFVVFEPATGQYFWNVDWQKDDYPQTSETDRLRKGSEFVASTAHGLSILDPGNPFLFIREVSSKAESSNAARQDALNRAIEHIADIEARANPHPKAYVDLRGAFPPGFIPEGPRSEPALPVKLIRVERKSGWWDFSGKPRNAGAWVLTYECRESDFKVKLTIADGVATLCPPSQMGCQEPSGATCTDQQGHDKQCPR